MANKKTRSGLVNPKGLTICRYLYNPAEILSRYFLFRRLQHGPALQPGRVMEKRLKKNRAALRLGSCLGSDYFFSGAAGGPPGAPPPGAPVPPPAPPVVPSPPAGFSGAGGAGVVPDGALFSGAVVPDGAPSSDFLQPSVKVNETRNKIETATATIFFIRPPLSFSIMLVEPRGRDHRCVPDFRFRYNLISYRAKDERSFMIRGVIFHAAYQKACRLFFGPLWLPPGNRQEHGLPENRERRTGPSGIWPVR